MDTVSAGPVIGGGQEMAADLMAGGPPGGYHWRRGGSHAADDRSHIGRAALAVLLLLATGGPLAAQEFAGREKLRAHSDEFRKDVIKVTDGVYTAVGFSDANSVLIQGATAGRSSSTRQTT
jgi:hypothetical protein